MGGCLSSRRQSDLSGNTFSHYSLTSQSEHLDLYPGFRYVETDSSLCEVDNQAVWRRSSVPLLQSWDTRQQDSISMSSTISNCNTIASEVNEVSTSEANTSRPDQLKTTTTQQSRPTRTFNIWNQAFVRLRNSLGRNKTIYSESGTKTASENKACVRLSSDTSEFEVIEEHSF